MIVNWYQEETAEEEFAKEAKTSASGIPGQDSQAATTITAVVEEESQSDDKLPDHHHHFKSYDQQAEYLGAASAAAEFDNDLV